MLAEGPSRETRSPGHRMRSILLLPPPSAACCRVRHSIFNSSRVSLSLSLSLSFFPNILLLFFLLSVYSFLQYTFIYHHLKKKNSLLFRMAYSKVIYGMLYIAKSHFDPCFAPFELDTGIDTTIYISTLDSHTRSPFGVAIKSTMNIRKVYIEVQKELQEEKLV